MSLPTPPTITALDTNVLIAMQNTSNPTMQAEAALAVVSRQMAGHQIIICNVVYAELIAEPTTTPAAVNYFLQLQNIKRHKRMPSSHYELAAKGYGLYTVARRSSSGGIPRRILPDFLIGAHAALNADELLTYDPKHFRRFPGLLVSHP